MIPVPPAGARPWTRLRRLAARHRRLAAAALLAVAAGVAVDAATARPPGGVALLVAARDLPAGRVVAPDDLTQVRVPGAAVPDGALAAADALTGRALAAPLRRGEAVTDARLVGPGLLGGAPAGTLAVPVRVDPASVGLVRAGDRVSVLAGPALDGLAVEGLGAADGEVLVRQATVLHVPEPAGGGLLDAASEAGVAVLALQESEAARVAGALGQRSLLLALLP